MYVVNVEKAKLGYASLRQIVLLIVARLKNKGILKVENGEITLRIITNIDGSLIYGKGTTPTIASLVGLVFDPALCDEKHYNEFTDVFPFIFQYGSETIENTKKMGKLFFLLEFTHTHLFLAGEAHDGVGVVDDGGEFLILPHLAFAFRAILALQALRALRSGFQTPQQTNLQQPLRQHPDQMDRPEMGQTADRELETKEQVRQAQELSVRLETQLHLGRYLHHQESGSRSSCGSLANKGTNKASTTKWWVNALLSLSPRRA